MKVEHRRAWAWQTPTCEGCGSEIGGRTRGIQDGWICQMKVSSRVWRREDIVCYSFGATQVVIKDASAGNAWGKYGVWARSMPPTRFQLEVRVTAKYTHACVNIWHVAIYTCNLMIVRYNQEFQVSWDMPALYPLRIYAVIWQDRFFRIYGGRLLTRGFRVCWILQLIELNEGHTTQPGRVYTQVAKQRSREGQVDSRPIPAHLILRIRWLFIGHVIL